MQIVNMQQAAQVARKSRRPKHTFQLRTRPWQIQPFMIAPVLPHETLTNAYLQARAVTDPLRNRLLGWRKDYMLFYVKLRDLDGRDDFTRMFTELNYDLSSYNSAATEWSNHFGTTVDWTALCLKRIVEEYFRDEGETWNSPALDSVPLAQLQDPLWMDSLHAEDTAAASDINLSDAGSKGGTNVLASEIQEALRTWTWLQEQNLTNLSYEDFLAQSGVQMAVELEPHMPELLRHWSEWTYPVNTVEPTTGVPTSACSWVVQGRADKHRYFKEHGFIVGVTVSRPKTYFKLSGSAVGLMTTMFPWLPSTMDPDNQASVLQVADGTGPIQNSTDDYIVDLRDLFMYGDQFINFANTATDAGLIDVPTAALVRRYADSDDANSLFLDDDPGTAIQVHEDGVVSLNILGHQQDAQPGTGLKTRFGANP